MEIGLQSKWRDATRAAALAIVLALLCGVLAWLVQYIFAKAGPLATVWLSNAVAVALLLRSPRSYWAFLLPAVWIGTGTANVLSGTPPAAAFALGLANMTESGVVAALLRPVFARHDTFDDPKIIIRFFLAALIGTVVASLLAAAMLAGIMGRPFLTSAIDWWVPDLLGMLTIAPLLLSFGHWSRWGLGEHEATPRRRNASGHVVQRVGAVLLFWAATAIAFMTDIVAMLFVLGPLLLITAVRLPLSAAMMSLLGGCMIALGMTINGTGPIIAITQDLLVEGRIFQAYMASLIFLVLPVRALARDRDRLDAAYADSDRKFRGIAESIRSGILHLDSEGQPHWANQHWEKLTGRSLEESRDAGWLEAIHSDHRLRAQALWARVRRGERGEPLEVRCAANPDAWMEISFSSMSEQDEIVGYVVKMSDISSRKADAVALEESEGLYRLVTEHARDIVFRIGLDQVPLYVSSASRSVLGFDPVELIGKPLSLKIHEQDRDLFARHFAEVLAGAPPPELSFRLRTKSGDYRWVEASTQLVSDAETGAPAEVVATLRDIQQRHETEQQVLESAEKLGESNRLLRLAEGLSQVGHWRLDTDSMGFRHSRQLAAMIGVDRDTALGPRELLRMLSVSDRRLTLATIGRARSAGRPSECGARVRTIDGQLRHFRLMVQAERDRSGKVGGLFGVVRDVTLEVRAQAELVAARDRANKAAASKSAFLATMSHEIRTPMTGVLGMIDLLRLQPTDEERDRYLGTLKRSADLLMAVLDDILDFSKIESGRMSFEQRDFRFEQLIAETKQLFDRSASAKGLVLRVEGDMGNLQPVRGDPVRLQQILSNLLSNAVKFTDEGEVVIRFSASPDQDRWRWRVAVSDTGIGIAPEEREHLFQPFTQADITTSRRFGGTGLGLAISRRLVEAMGGRMKVDSQPGRGATFSFEILLEQGSEPVIGDIDVPVLASKAQSDGQNVGLKLLVAEDNPVNQMLLSAILSQLGHDMRAVDNGRLAVERAAAEPFDAIIMDMQMPELDGLAATRQIRAGGGPNASIPIIALTADASPERRRFYDGAGLSAFLTKPIDQEALADQLAAIAAQCGSGDSEQSSTPLLDDDRLAAISSTLGAERLDALLDLLRGQLECTPAALAAHMKSGDMEALRREAHALKGAAANAGAGRVAERAASIEAARERDGAEALLATLEADVSATIEAIAARLGSERKSLEK
ncbi:PAS domain S-box protein [Sphingomicrobium marinum]|uniref:PAS domain S-box protein n=1 Tax=Sphingomicrobium marinum TaxID=1227950 RepID=UPI00224043FF|nr:PAS domain S-box protein [Sphingomicrobium marinum]